MLHLRCTHAERFNSILYINFFFFPSKPIRVRGINLFQVIEKDVIKCTEYQTLALERKLCLQPLTVFLLIFFFFFLTNADRSLLVHNAQCGQMAAALSAVCFLSNGLSCQLLANLCHWHYLCLSPSIFISSFHTP